MRIYETIYIIQPEASEDEVEKVAQGVELLITEGGGAIVNTDVWGKRRLAYEVKGFHEGIYILIRFECNPEFPKKLEDALKLNESVIRYLVIFFDDKTLRLETEQARRNQAALESRTAADSDRRPRDREDAKSEDSKERVEA